MAPIGADRLDLGIEDSRLARSHSRLHYGGVRPVLEGTLSGDTFTTVNKYVWEGDSYYDPLVFASFGGEWRYFTYDGLGSTRQLLDANQTVTDSYSYEAFGNLLSDGGQTPNPYIYVGSLGYYTTGAPSLLHLGARYYEPALGRFLQWDPVRVPPGYVYAASAPTRYVDPRGLWCILIWVRSHKKRHVTSRETDDWNLTLQQSSGWSGTYLCIFWRMVYERGYYETWFTKCHLCSCPSLHIECYDTAHRTEHFSEERRENHFRGLAGGTDNPALLAAQCMGNLKKDPLPR